VIDARRRRLFELCAVASLALTVTIIGILWGTRVAGGSDAYGYVSQADLWLHGDLHIDQGFGARVPWPLARWTFLPLGYRPEPDGFRIVPQYPPGLPLLMAGAKALAGQCAMFWIVPLSAGVLVAATYAIGRRIGRPVAGLAAAWLVAASPTQLFMLMAPMSDVPAAAAWAIAIAFALGETTTAAAAAGLAASAAILIRPNLVPIAAVMFAWLMFGPAGQARRSGGAGKRAGLIVANQAIAFAATASLGAFAVAAINTRLYGSPFATGYDLTDGFAFAYVWTNLKHYAGWLVTAESPLALAGLAVLAIPSRRVWPSPRAARARLLFLGVALVVWAIYLLYVPWDAWWYLRFLLPTWPLAALGAAALASLLAGPVGHAAQVGPAGRPARVVAASVVVAIGAHGMWQAYRRETFSVARGEAKYVEVARTVESITDRDAVIVSAQHSGSLRYYAGRLTLRWDVGDVAWLDRTVEWLAAHGHHPYLVLEPQEIAELRARYGPANAVARLDWTPLVVFRGGAVVMYDALRREKTGAAVSQPELRAVRECPMQRPPPALR
jgi:hypothetical protein